MYSFLLAQLFVPAQVDLIGMNLPPEVGWVGLLIVTALTVNYIARRRADVNLENAKAETQRAQAELETVRSEQEQEKAQSAAIRTLAETISGFQGTLNNFIEQGRLSTAAIQENTRAFRAGAATRARQIEQTGEMLEIIRPLATAIPEAVSIIVRKFTGTEVKILDALKGAPPPVGVLLLNADQQIVGHNPQAAEIFGLSGPLPSLLPADLILSEYPSRKPIPRASWHCFKAASELRSTSTVVGVSRPASDQVVWLWLIAEPLSGGQLRLAFIDAGVGAAMFRQIESETPSLTRSPGETLSKEGADLVPSSL